MCRHRFINLGLLGQGQSEQGAKILGEVGASLESEQRHLDALEKQVRAGRRLIQQKEQKLQQLASQRQTQEVRLWEAAPWFCVAGEHPLLPCYAPIQGMFFAWGLHLPIKLFK